MLGQPRAQDPAVRLHRTVLHPRPLPGASLGYQISGIGADLAPVVFASVLAGGGTTTTVSIIIAAGCLLTIGSILALRETATADLTADPEVTAATAGR